MTLFSGSLQYVDDWQAIIRETNAEIFIARTPLDDIERRSCKRTPEANGKVV